MTLLSVGVAHEHADLDLLEAVAVPEERLAKVLRALVESPNVSEAVLLSTCLRTEVYAVIDRFHGAVEEITAVIAAAAERSEDDLRDRLTIHFDRGVAGHLFAVAAGLCSAVPGEYEVLGQVRRSLERAIEEGTAGPELIELFQRAVAAGRRARHETAIARGTTSFAAATVDLARREVGGSLDGVRAVVLGAGQLAAGVARSLRDEPGVIDIVVANRTASRATELVTDLADARARAVPLDDVATAIADASVVVAAIEAPAPVLSLGDLVGRTTPLLILDLGVPRVVASDVTENARVTRLDLSDLRAVIDLSLEDRRESLAAADAIVTEEADHWHDDRRTRGAATIVRELRESFEVVRVRELERHRSALTSLDDTEMAAVDAMTRALVAKLLHAPSVALKEAAGTDRGHRLTDTTRNLFDL